MCETYALDLLLMCAVLAILSIASLVYTARTARESALGRLLLDASAGDYDTALLTIENAKAEAELIAELAKRAAKS
jgi:hypothetical protein